MIIEFLGVPGIGKSYVVNRFSEKLKESNIESRITNEKYYSIKNKHIWRIKKTYSIGKLLSKSTTAWKVLFLILKDDSLLKFRISNAYNVLSVLSSNKIDEKEKQIILRDEGIYQMLFSLKLFSNTDTEQVSKLFKKIIKTPSIVIYLYSSGSVIDGLKVQDKGGRIYQCLKNGSLNENRIRSSIDHILKLNELDSITIKKYEYNKSDEKLCGIIDNLMLEVAGVEQLLN